MSCHYVNLYAVISPILLIMAITFPTNPLADRKIIKFISKWNDSIAATSYSLYKVMSWNLPYLNVVLSFNIIFRGYHHVPCCIFTILGNGIIGPLNDISILIRDENLDMSTSICPPGSVRPTGKSLTTNSYTLSTNFHWLSIILNFYLSIAPHMYFLRNWGGLVRLTNMTYILPEETKRESAFRVESKDVADSRNHASKRV